MTTLARWWRFNLVGAMGMAVQLGTLALLNRLAPGRYLAASAAAVELAVLHNFVWHLHYTWGERWGERWRDARGGAAWRTPLLQFHLSNGLVSLLGNVMLMRLLVHGARMPVLAANGVAIVCCSMVNFCLGNNWAFAARA